MREQQTEGGNTEDQELFTDLKIHTKIISKSLCKTGPQTLQSSQASGGALQLWLTQEQGKVLLGVDALAIGN